MQNVLMAFIFYLLKAYYFVTIYGNYILIQFNNDYRFLIYENPLGSVTKTEISEDYDYYD